MINKINLNKVNKVNINRVHNHIKKIRYLS